MEISKAIKKRIMDLCKQRNLSYRRLSSMTGLDNTVSTYLSKSSNVTISLSTILCICRAFEITLTEFFSSVYFKDIDELK